MTVLWNFRPCRGILNHKAMETGNRQAGMIHYKDLIIDTEEQRVYCQGEQVHITQTEYRLLMVLLNGAGRVYSRAELLHRVWDVTAPIQTRTVDIHIARLRQKLGLQEEIRSVMRKGYSLKRR